MVLIMLFHITSEYIHRWLKSQSAVKEESITDWLLFNISQQTDMVYYKTFTRNEEAFNGSDWEWWIIADGNFGIQAYRFLVQAKKLNQKLTTIRCYHIATEMVCRLIC